MVLDLDLFRSDKGHDPEKIKENQKKRFKDVGLVETVIAEDTEWRGRRHQADNFNKVKNICSKEIGVKMKKKEPVGDESEPVPDDVQVDLCKITSEILKPLTVSQIKKIRSLVDQAILDNEKQLQESEKKRNHALREVGNKNTDLGKGVK